MNDSRDNLRLGAGLVEMLLPQRRPLRMVDFVRRFSDKPRPVLLAGRHISINEPFFEGHFDGLPIWPGVLTIEGLGQTATLLMIFAKLLRGAEERGDDPETVLEALRNADRGTRLHPGFKPHGLASLVEELEGYRNHLAVGASVNVKFLRPIFAGCRLDYRVEWTTDLGDMMSFDVEASCDGEPVVTGRMTGALVKAPGWSGS